MQAKDVKSTKLGSNITYILKLHFKSLIVRRGRGSSPARRPISIYDQNTNQLLKATQRWESNPTTSGGRKTKTSNTKNNYQRRRFIPIITLDTSPSPIAGSKYKKNHSNRYKLQRRDITNLPKPSTCPLSPWISPASPAGSVSRYLGAQV